MRNGIANALLNQNPSISNNLNDINQPNSNQSKYIAGQSTSNNGQTSGGGVNGNNVNAANETNQAFEKILSEVIHVNAFDQRGINSTNMNGDSNQVQDMPIKLNGLVEPTKQQLALPEGVPAGNTLSVLAAQPPFISDIRLINNVAHEANASIMGYSLEMPTNVTFDFN